MAVVCATRDVHYDALSSDVLHKVWVRQSQWTGCVWVDTCWLPSFFERDFKHEGTNNMKNLHMVSIHTGGAFLTRVYVIITVCSRSSNISSDLFRGLIFVQKMGQLVWGLPIQVIQLIKLTIALIYRNEINVIVIENWKKKYIVRLSYFNRFTRKASLWLSVVWWGQTLEDSGLPTRTSGWGS